MQSTDVVTRARFSVRAMLHALVCRRCFFRSFTHGQKSLLLESVQASFRVFRDLQMRCRCLYMFKPGSVSRLTQVFVQSLFQLAVSKTNRG